MKHKAFTLAEVLITLSIIGVVAALTIPSLIVNNQEKQTVVQLKKAYNVFSNAFALAEVEYGSVGGWGWNNAGGLQSSIAAMDKMSPFLNIIRRCDGTTGCFPKVNYKELGGNNNGIFDDLARSKAIFADGMIFNIEPVSQDCTANSGSGYLQNTCGRIYVDINGFSKPNMLGKDTFGFHITTYGIIPIGTPGDIVAPLKDECQNASGWGCTAWVLQKENLDYPLAGTGWDGETSSTP